MDNRTIEEVRKNETKLINEIKILEYKYKVAMNNLLTMAKVMGDPRLIEEFEEKVEREGQRKRT